MGPARVQPLDQTPNVVVAAEVECGVLFLEREQTGKRRAMRIEGEAALGVERDLRQFASQPFEPALLIFLQVERLDVGRYQGVAGRRFDDGKDGLPERARLGEFGKAPLGTRASSASG